jgi:hypothetical protein
MFNPAQAHGISKYAFNTAHSGFSPLVLSGQAVNLLEVVLEMIRVYARCNS